MNNRLPVFHEHGDDHLIPLHYGIEESHDGGFYPYKIIFGGGIEYWKDVNGLDLRKDTYEQALEHVAEIVD